MRFKCPNCGNPVDPSALRSGDRVVCDGCQKRLKPPPPDQSLEMQYHDETLDVLLPPQPLPPPTPPQHTRPLVAQAMPVHTPMIVAMPTSHEPEEYIREKIEDLRDLRTERRERRGYYNLDRSGNPPGMVGFALACTSFVLALSGGLFMKDLPVYTLFVIIVGMPVSLVALPFGIIGCLKQGRNKLFAAIGTGISALTLMLLYPALMMSLVNRWGG